jgi:hypothetical protein
VSQSARHDRPDLHVGQRVVFVKRGESRHYDTEWRATYLYGTPSGRCAIRVDGWKRIRIVRRDSLLTEDVQP